MRPHRLIAFLALVLPLAAATDRLGGAALVGVGGWAPLKNVSDPEVKSVAEFAVTEYNKKVQGQNKLEFKDVVRGESQVVAGTKFRVIIAATNASELPVVVPPEYYEGVVWDKPWEHFRELLSFAKTKL